MDVMNFKYTNTWETFENYCEILYQGFIHRYGKDKGVTWEHEMRKQYAFEMKFIRNKVIENKEILKQFWMAAFIGMLSKKYNLTINVYTESCPYVLHLLDLIPYDVMEKEELHVKYHYPYAGISLTKYEVGKNFYCTVKAEVETFFSNSGYEFLWLGQNENDDFEMKPVGIVVLPQNKSKLDYLENLGKLRDGSVCFKDEVQVSYGMLEDWDLLFYYFEPTKLHTKLDEDICEGIKIDKTKGFVCTWKDMIDTGLMTSEEQLRFQYYMPKGSYEMMNIVASSMAYIDYSEISYEDWQKYSREFTREDIFESLINIVMTEKNACYWTNMIRKGRFAKTYRKCNQRNKREEHLFCHDDVERYKAIKYLPSRWNVLTRYELYRRCAIQRKIIEKREEESVGYAPMGR